MTTTESELFDALTDLDELIQVIYQGAHRFVVMSRLHLPYSFASPSTSAEANPHWDIYLGHADKFRWWRARWREEDLKRVVGSSASTSLIEAFAGGIVKALVDGELYVSGIPDLTAEDNSDIKIVFGPGGKSPLSISLTELSDKESRTFLTSEFFNVSMSMSLSFLERVKLEQSQLGLSAKERKCKLNPPSFTSFEEPIAVSTSTMLPSKRTRQESPEAPLRKAITADDMDDKHLTKGLRDAQERPKAENLSQEKANPVKKTMSRAVKSSSGRPGLGPATGKKPVRRVQAMEFGDDDDE